MQGEVINNKKCFGVSERGFCQVLIGVGKCVEPQKCRFYKTREQLWAEEERLIDRKKRHKLS